MLEGSEEYNASESTGDIILETNNTDMEVHDMARTVICILCNGTIDYKNEDSTTFRKHMKDQHGAFHHIDYILASCFLPQVEIENVARKPLKELEAQELSKVEELQETLAEDSEPGQHGRGKRVAEDLQVGMPVNKKMKKADMKMELEVESSQEESMDGVALEEGDGEAAGNVEVDDSLDLGHQEQVEGLEQKNHSSKGAKMFPCDLCEKKFTSEKGSRSHMTRIHGTAPRSGRRGKNINTESIVNQSHPTETVAEEGVEATELEDMFNSGNQNSDDQTGFEQGNIGETSSLEMEDSMADDSADLESKEVDDLTIEGAAITEDVNAIERYQDVPAESDTSMDIADVAAIDQESNEAIKEVAGRLMCSFGCGKSYGTKGSLANHEIKVHNRPKLLKGRKSQKPTVEMKLEESGQDGMEAKAVTEMGSSGELVSQTEEADTPGASEQKLGGSTMQSGRLSDFDFEIQESEVGGDSVDEKDAGVEDGHVEATIEVGLTSSSEVGGEMMRGKEDAAQDEERTNQGEGITGHVEENIHQEAEMAVKREEATEQGGEASTQGEETSDQGEVQDDERQLGDGDSPMTNEDQEKQDEDKQFDENVPEKQSGSLDIQGSEYFTKYPKAIANPQEKSLKLFKNAEGLPEGWKVRLLNDPKGDGKTVRHYLSPDMRVLKTGQGVVEYLRLAGTLSKDQILEIAKNVLLLSEKKISALFH